MGVPDGGGENLQPRSFEQLFCRHLPPNLEKLILQPLRDLENYQDGSVSDVPDSLQVEDVIFEPSKLLPCVCEIPVGTALPDHGSYLGQALKGYRFSLKDLKVNVGCGQARCAPTRSAFDGILPTLRLPKTKLDESRYSIIPISQTRSN